MSVLKPKQPIQPYQSGYTSGPTPIADFFESLFKGTVIAIMGPIFVLVIVMAPSALLVYGIGGVTGLTDAWAQLVVQASTTPGAADFAAMLLQNVLFGAVVSLVLAIPVIRRSLESYKLRDAAHSLGTSTAVAALQLSAAALLLHVALGILVAAIMTALGMLLPMPGGYGTAVAPDTLAFFFVTGGAGGGWPPTVDTLSAFALVALTAMILLGALLGATLWLVLGFVAQRLLPASSTEAAGGGASALGAALSNALTRGEDSHMRYSWPGSTIRTGLVQGALTGALFATLVLASAAVLGVG